MVDFTISGQLGGVAPAPIGDNEMLQGIGYPLRPVNEVTVNAYTLKATDDAGSGDVASDVNATDFTGQGDPVSPDTYMHIRSADIVNFVHKDVLYSYTGPKDVLVGLGGDYTTLTADFIAQGTADHDLLNNISADDHHDQSHAHDGADSSGTVAHVDLTGKTVDDHHAQSHAHNGADSSGTVAHASLTGKTTDDHHPISHVHNGVDGSGQVNHVNVLLRDAANSHPQGAVTDLVADQATQNGRLDTLEAITNALYDISLEEAIMINPTAASFADGATITNYTTSEAIDPAALIVEDLVNGTVTIGVEGWYTLSGYLEATGSNNSAFYGVRVHADASDFILGIQEWSNSTPGMAFSGAIKVPLTAGTVVRMSAYASTGTLDVVNGSLSVEMESLN